ncbi:MAG: lipoyl(octanoyl) transferase LipB [Actinobacteria bacterium]|nr:lipoyl(octanoyl) transferase LipB [Actinomycetota bacterium]
MTVPPAGSREQVADPRPVEFRYLGLAEGVLSDYHEAWALQREVHARVASGELGPQVLYVEHPPVYTAGRRTEPHERPFDGTPVVDVDRGGKITYHGPGQLVGYPIVFLPRAVGVVDYVRRVEEALIRLLAGYGVATGRVPGRTGVWLAADEERPERKIAAIGIRVSRQTTMHGFALNVASDLADFGRIVPCGITDAGVTSLEAELGRPAPSLLEVGRDLEPHLRELLAFQPFEQSPDLHAGVAAPEELPDTPTITYGLTG